MHNSALAAGGDLADSNPNATQEVTPTDTGAIAAALYRLRRRRDKSFRGPLFSEPSWDLLLELLAAEKSGSHVSIKTACLAAAVPNTTAVRCLRQLEHHGIVFRQVDPEDRRRIIIRLTETSAKMMESLFSDLCHCFAPFVAGVTAAHSSSPMKQDISPTKLDDDSIPIRLDQPARGWCSENANKAKKGKQMQELSGNELDLVSGGVSWGELGEGIAAVGTGLVAIGGGVGFSVATGGVGALGGAAVAVAGAGMVAGGSYLIGDAIMK